MSKLKVCGVCGEHFNYYHEVVKVEDDEQFYHKDCLELVPTGFFATANGEPLGVVEVEPDWAMIILGEDEYLDDDEEESE